MRVFTALQLLIVTSCRMSRYQKRSVKIIAQIFGKCTLWPVNYSNHLEWYLNTTVQNSSSQLLSLRRRRLLSLLLLPHPFLPPHIWTLFIQLYVFHLGGRMTQCEKVKISWEPLLCCGSKILISVGVNKQLQIHLKCMKSNTRGEYSRYN